MSQEASLENKNAKSSFVTYTYSFMCSAPLGVQA